MDPEEERVLYLCRVGHEKIFKYGTYNLVREKPITQDHPFYVKREDVATTASNEPVPVGVAPAEPVDPEALAAQVISSNFKVGLSQEEVDALLNGM